MKLEQRTFYRFCSSTVGSKSSTMSLTKRDSTLRHQKHQIELQLPVTHSTSNMNYPFLMLKKIVLIQIGLGFEKWFTFEFL